MKRLAFYTLLIALFSAIGLTATQSTQAQGTLTGGNWQAEYFNDAAFSPPAAFTRVDNVIQFQFGAASPSNGVTTLPADNFSIRWTGTQPVTAAGTYQFTAVAEDDVQVGRSKKVVE